MTIFERNICILFQITPLKRCSKSTSPRILAEWLRHLRSCRLLCLAVFSKKWVSYAKKSGK
eukprot:UN00463